MKKTLFIIVLVAILCMECFAESDFEFNIDVGEKPSQLGYKTGNEYDLGPIAITEYNNNIYILDGVAHKINIYTKQGEFKRCLYIPNNLQYRDLTVSAQNNILLLSDKGIYKFKRNFKLEKIYDIPQLIDCPLYFSSDQFGVLALSGFSKGREKVGLISPKESFKLLEGYEVVLSRLGLIGLQISKNEIELIKNGEILSKATINTESTMTVIGVTENMNVYCISPIKKGVILYRTNKEGETTRKKINYSSELIEGSFDIIKFIRVNQKGEVIALEVNRDKCRVLRISL